MNIYLHKSLCDLNKAGQLATSADRGVGEQKGGDYFHRIQTGYNKDNTPAYRYFRTKEEWDGYLKKQGKTGHERTKKTGEESAQRLKEKTTEEHEESSKKQSNSLFIRDKNKKIAKGLFIAIEERNE